MTDELGRKIITKFTGLGPKVLVHLKDNDTEGNESKGTNICAIKWKRRFKGYKNCQKVSRRENKLSYSEKKLYKWW